jgi:hypothetical protein
MPHIDIAANKAPVPHSQTDRVFDVADPDRHGKIINAGPEVTEVKFDDGAVLARSIDRDSPCCKNLAFVRPGHGPHAAELRCTQCNRFRGWLPRQTLSFLDDVTTRFGAPLEPLVLKRPQFWRLANEQRRLRQH